MPLEARQHDGQRKSCDDGARDRHSRDVWADASASGAGANSYAGRAAFTAQDHIEIQQLVRKYAWALDGGDNYGYAYADLFTPDGVFLGMNQGPSGRSYQGRDVLAALARTPAGGPNNQRHFTMNHAITPTLLGRPDRDGPGLCRHARCRHRGEAERRESRWTLRRRLREDECRLAIQEADVLGIEGRCLAGRVVSECPSRR